MLEQIQAEIEAFFNGLNWTYIFIYTMVLYGIKNNEEFEWYNELLDRNKWLKKFKVWIAGLIVAAFFTFFTYKAGNTPIDSEFFSQTLRSWILVIVFNTVASKKIKQSIDKIDTPDKKI